MRKLLFLFLTVAIMLLLCSCSSPLSFFNSKSNSNSGNQAEIVEQKSYSEGSCGAVAQDGNVHKISISIENGLGEDMNGLYVCKTGETEWSNLFDEDEYLSNGKIAEDYLDIAYSSDTLSYDIGIKDGQNNVHEFNSLDISNLSSDGFTLKFGKTADGTYYWNVDKSFVR